MPLREVGTEQLKLKTETHVHLQVTCDRFHNTNHTHETKDGKCDQCEQGKQLSFFLNPYIA